LQNGEIDIDRDEEEQVAEQEAEQEADQMEVDEEEVVV